MRTGGIVSYYGRMLLPTLLIAAVCSPSHASGQLPAGPEALVLTQAALLRQDVMGIRVRQAVQDTWQSSVGAPRLTLAAASAGPGLDVIFAPLGRSGHVAPVPPLDGGSGVGAKGTYEVTSISAGQVSFQLTADLISGQLTIALAGPGRASLHFAGTTGGKAVNVAASGNYSYDAATRTGTISYSLSDGSQKTESFTLKSSGMRMTLAGMLHEFTRDR